MKLHHDPHPEHLLNRAVIHEHLLFVRLSYVGELNDLEFWLSTDATPAKQTAESAPAPAAASEETPTHKTSKKKSKKKGGANAEPMPPQVSAVMDEPEVGEEVEPTEGNEEEEVKRRKKERK